MLYEVAGNKTFNRFAKNVMTFHVCSHVSSNIICGDLSVFKDWTEFGKVFFQMIGRVNVAQQPSKQFTS